MLIHEIKFGTPEYDEAVAIRYEVLRKPLGLQYTPEQLAAEYDQFHLAAFDDNGVMTAYLNLTPTDDPTLLKMRQVAVSPQRQGQGIGTQLVQFAESFARDKGYAGFVLHARETAVPFYLHLNYVREGDRFEEVTIPHFKMRKTW